LENVEVRLLRQIIRLDQFWHVHEDVKHWLSQFIPDYFLGTFL